VGVARPDLRSNDSSRCDERAHSILCPDWVDNSTAVSAARARYQLSQRVRFLLLSKWMAATSNWIGRRRGYRNPLIQFAANVIR
jgi:hypothetical protein